MTEKTKVAVVGFGTIGTGVARLLLDRGDRSSRHAKGALHLQAIVDPDTRRSRGIDLPAGLLTDDLTRVTGDPEIAVVAQLIGGLEPARTIMLQLLESGKDVVTANKALLAEHGPELFRRARQLGRSIAFEAAVAGGVPIITGIGQCLAANQVESLHAILNGTSNFILTRMEELGQDYAAAVSEAQSRGYAEADPTMDVDGSDAAQKLAIMAQLAFGARVDWKNIPREGIDNVDLADLRWAGELGYRLKVLAVAQRSIEGVELHVSPTLVRHGTPLAEVRGAYNAISVVGDAVGRVFFEGLGAGQMPTASAVVGDLIDMALGHTGITFSTLRLWPEGEGRVAVREPGDVSSRFYLRLNVEDRPGVLAEIAGVLGWHEISIASVIQHEADEEAPQKSIVPLIIMTHTATEGAAATAMETIDGMPFVRPGSVRMRVYDS